jgi:epoxide hydrolase 4
MTPNALTMMAAALLAGSVSASQPPPTSDYDQPPRAIRITKPQYPQEAFVKRIEGTVEIEILIDTGGNVARARVVQSIPALDQAALQTVYQWRFTPAVKNGHPVATIARAPVMFRLWYDKYAEVNGVRLHYVEEGHGPLILFLHGFPQFWYEWKELLAEFARDHHAVAPDMRGYNLSSKPSAVEDYRVPLLVEDVRALASQLGAKKFVLVGHDWGGVIAWAFAAAHPQMLEKLIIVNAPHPTVFARELANNPNQQKASSYFNLFTSPKAEETLGQNNFQRLQDLLQGWGSDEDRRMYLENWNRGLTGGLNYYRAAHLSPPSPAMDITVPTLVIWGEKDTALLTGNLEGLDQYVKNLRVERIPDGSHWVIHEQSKLVIQHMRDFLKH